MNWKLAGPIAGLLLAGCSAPHADLGPAGRNTLLTPLSDARPAPAEEFNAARDRLRIVALFSPT